MSRLEEWDAAYRAANYRVLLPAGELLLRVSLHRAEDDARLRLECGVREHWAVLTPCNPGSRRLDAAENVRRLDQLAGVLRTRELRHHDTVSSDPAGRWPDEPGFLLCDPLPGLAETLGRDYAQNAILIGRLGTAPELLWLS